MRRMEENDLELVAQVRAGNADAFRALVEKHNRTLFHTALRICRHQQTAEDIPPAEAVRDFEAQALADSGMDFDLVPPRYRTTYFSHIMGGYSAGYYSYIWSEVMDADSVKWFKENGGMTRENGDHFRETLLSRGGSQDAMELFRNFRGAEPSIEPLLERLGLN